MSLRIWLPLEEDLQNQGLDDITFVNNGASHSSDGKIGSCYSFGGTSSRIYANNVSLSNAQMSGCCWVNISSFGSTSSYIFSLGSNVTGPGHQIGIFAQASGILYITANGSQLNTGYTLSLSTWYHICFTYKGNSSKLYVNGQLVYSGTNTNSPKTQTCFCVGARSNSTSGAGIAFSFPFSGKINDLRIYDHELSIKEIKEISKGLILHYKLDENINYNLLKDGFGELNGENWDGSDPKLDTTDIPSGDPFIKGSIIGERTSIEYIPINNLCNYKIQLWIKSSATSGYTYPSIVPYDVDKKIIKNYNVTFNNATMTTLSQSLNTGDTKIYVNDLSAWNANSGHYYNFAAIFGYKDSTGYVYPNGTYTQNVVAFGSGTSEKINLDKENNIITLLEPYGGDYVPGGTAICAAPAGGVYVYPLGAILNSSINNWTYKTGTFNNSEPRFKYSHYIKYCTYSDNLKTAGIRITNLTTLSNQIYDSSGYQRNGEIVGSIESTSDTPRYETSIHFSGTNQKIKISNLVANGFRDSYSFSWWGKVNTFEDKMMWGFSNGSRLNLYGGIYCNTGDSTSDPFYIPDTTTIITAPSTNEWHHFVMTGNGTLSLLYVDGQLYGQAKNYKPATGSNIYINGGGSRGSYALNDMSISDFRIYATALSAEDVKELYHTSASIDRSQNLYIREVIE